jgi:ferredoxin
LARCDGPEAQREAVAAVWPDLPEGGSVALVAMPVGPQGEVDARAVPVSLIAAAARHLGAGGASVRVVAVPTTLDLREPFDAAVAELRAAGLDVCTEPAAVSVELPGPLVARAELIAPVASADRVVVLAAAAPHHHLGLAGPLLAAAGVLSPLAREALFREASAPEQLLAALEELAASLGSVQALATLGPELGTLVGGDLVAVEAVIRRCFGLEAPEVVTTGLDPALVVRAASSARDALPPAPERYPGVEVSLCTRCEVCTSLCPTGAIALPGGRGGAEPLEFDLSACIRCGICAAACPDFAIAPTVRPMAARLRPVQHLELPPVGAAPRPQAVPVEAALALGPLAIDPPARRPAWLDSYEPPDRYERARARERHPEPRAPRTTLPRDGHVRLVIPPNWGIRENHTSLGIAYLAAALREAGVSLHVADLARDTRAWDPALGEALAVVGDPDPNGGFYGPRVPLLLQVVDPAAWGAARAALRPPGPRERRPRRAAHRRSDRAARPDRRRQLGDLRLRAGRGAPAPGRPRGPRWPQHEPPADRRAGPAPGRRGRRGSRERARPRWRGWRSRTGTAPGTPRSARALRASRGSAATPSAASRTPAIASWTRCPSRTGPASACPPSSCPSSPRAAA